MLREAGGHALRLPRALVVLVGVAVLLRIVLTVVHHPAILNTHDTLAYVEMANGAMFADETRTAGYPMFLRALHLVFPQLEFTVLVQHLLGVVTGCVLYLIVMRVGAPRWAALVAGAAVWLSLDNVALEHSLMSEPLFVFLLVSAIYAVVRAMDEQRAVLASLTSQHLWLAAAGILLGLSAWVRPVGAPLIAVVALWAAFALPGRPWTRLGRGMAVAAAGLVVLLVYVDLSASRTGQFGVVRGSGWILYARVAPFADCREFTAPEGTSGLCETTPPDERLSPDDYLEGESPARAVFGEIPAENDKLRAFAIEAIVSQPLRYAVTVVNDTVRYFVPGHHARYVGTDYPVLEIRRRWLELEPALLAAVNAYYGDESLDVEEDGAVVLTDFQELLRVHPVLMLQSLILGIAGIVLARGRVRRALILLLCIAAALLIVPSATAGWAARYSIPSAGIFIAAGAIGLWVVFARLDDRRQAGWPDDSRAASRGTASYPAA
jgi:hypothetical protein